MHLALLGDSIFDNKVYVAANEPAVIEQVNSFLGQNQSASLLAVDGHTTKGIPHQLKCIDDSMSHFVMSVGGNDALGYMSVLQKSTKSVGEALFELAQVKAVFERDYRLAIEALLDFKRPTALCTVYHPRYEDVVLQSLMPPALSILDDVIYRLALEYSLPVLELRAIFTEDKDYANPIEPSAIGGEKLAKSIVRMMTQHDFANPKTVIWR